MAEEASWSTWRKLTYFADQENRITRLHRGVRTPAQFTMPPFADHLSDHDIADIPSFVRTGWGDQQTTVDAGQVAHLRKVLAPLLAAKSTYDSRANDADTRK